MNKEDNNHKNNW